MTLPIIRRTVTLHHQLLPSAIRAQNEVIPGVRDNQFHRRTTQYHSQVFRRTNDQKSTKYVHCFSVHASGADYLVTIYTF